MRSLSAGVLAAFIVILGWPAVAPADVRSASVADARDTEAHNQLDGTVTYDPWDIERVTATYDDAGSLAITVRFYEPMPGGFIDQEEYSVGVAQNDCFATDRGDFNVTLNTEEIARPGLDPLFAPIPGVPSIALSMVWLTDYEGQLPYTTAVSADLREFTLTATHQALAGRPYGCVTAGQVSTSWGSGCNEYRCWDGGTLTADSHKAFRFAGAPPVSADPGAGSGKLPYLSASATRRYLRTALRRNFKSARNPRFSGCSRRSDTRVRCQVKWRNGQLSYRGPATIWFTREPDGSVMWNYAYTIRRTDRACRAAGRSGCVKRFRVT